MKVLTMGPFHGGMNAWRSFMTLLTALLTALFTALTMGPDTPRFTP